MRTPLRLAAFGSLLLTLVTTFPLLAGPPAETNLGLSVVERRERVEAQLPAVLASPVHQEFLRDQGLGKVDSVRVERYLAWLPVPPMELFSHYQELRHDSTPIPSSIDERQTRWVGLHEAEARTLYGDRYVDTRLGLAEQGAGFASRALQYTEGNIALGTYQHVQPNEYQGEVMLAVNPNNPNQIVTAANTYDKIAGLCNSEKTQALAASQDGGKSWTYTCAPESSVWSLGTCPAGAEILGADPAVAWNGAGEVFVNHLVVCRVSDNDARMAVVTIRSQDGGVTWQKRGLVTNGWPGKVSNDKNMFAIDTNPASPYFNRQYSCWHRGPFAVTAYSSTGLGWSEQQFPLMGNVFKGVFGCELAVGKDGVVHLVLNSDDANQPGRLTYFRSETGGQTWTDETWFSGVQLGFKASAAAQDHRGIYPFATIDVDRSNGPCAGNLYVAYTDRAAAEAADSANIFLRWSDTDGATWSAPIKVNDDGLANRVQFHPALKVDPSNGAIYLAWYDARNSSSNRSVEIYAARSTDCGLSFESNVRVTSPSPDFHNFIPRYSDENQTDNPVANPNQYGEYMGLDAAGGKAYIAWTDSREIYPFNSTLPEKENIAFARVDFAAQCGNGVVESSEVCDGAAVAGKTCTSMGFPGGTLGCYNDCRAIYTGGCNGTRFYSYEMYDGTVEVSGGGSVFVKDTGDGFGIRIGDTASNGSRRGFLSFDTSAIPNNAVIKSASLQLHRAAVTGTNPFNAGLGTLSLTMSHAFSGDIALEAEDYDATFLPGSACFLPGPASDHGLALCKLGATALTHINKAGHTQFRLNFNTGSNGNSVNDYMSFFDGASLGAIDRPLLVVEW